MEKFILRNLSSFLPDANRVFTFNKYSIVANEEEFVIIKRFFGKEHIYRAPLESVEEYSVDFQKSLLHRIGIILSVIIIPILIIGVSINLQNYFLLVLLFPNLGFYDFIKGLVRINIDYGDGQITDLANEDQVLKWFDFMQTISDQNYSVNKAQSVTNERDD